MVFHLSESFYLNLKESIMTLPLSGTITLSAINVELGKAANAQASFNDGDVWETVDVSDWKLSI